jgi:site-specific recombinase
MSEITCPKCRTAFTPEFDFLKEALEISVQWIQDLTGQESGDIRAIITSHIKGARSVEAAAINEIDRAITALEVAKAKLAKNTLNSDPNEDEDSEDDSEVKSSSFRAKALKTLDFLGLLEDKNEVKSSGSLRKFANSLGLVDLEPAK